MTANRWLVIGTSVLFAAAISFGVAAWISKREADRLAEQNLALQQTQVELHDTQVELNKSVQQAREQTRALDDAVKDSKQYQQEQRNRAARAHGLVGGLQAAAGVKVAMTEFFLTEGKWPSSNQEFGLPAAGSQEKGMQSVTVLPGGKIRVANTDVAHKAEFVMLSASVNAAGQVTWICTTSNIPDIAQFVSGCAYQAATR
jgi:type IV pilus assembly protein PilA